MININFDNSFISKCIEILDKCYYLTIEISKNESNKKYIFQISNTKTKLFFNKYSPELKKDTIKILVEKIKSVDKEIDSFNYYNNLPDYEDYEHLINLSINNDSLIILYLSNLIDLSYCNSINEYNKIIEDKKREIYNINSKNLITNIYYRGNKLNYDLSPSIYRNHNNELPKYEHIINNRIIQNMPNDFNGCEDFFDKLTILKHFNCPSRLLDITQNHLIASFFALDEYYSNNNSYNYGVINFCFTEDYKQIKNSKNSDSVILLSALATTDKLGKVNFSFIDLTSNLELIYDNILKDSLWLFDKEDIIKMENQLNKILHVINRSTEKIEYNSIERLLSVFPNIYKIYTDKKLTDSELISIKRRLKRLIKLIQNNRRLNKYDFFQELQHQARAINQTFELFQPTYNDINSYYVVHPALNNKRIINQKGLFILIGAKKDKDGYFLKSNTDYLSLFEKNDNSGSKRVAIIINNSNNEFYKSLDLIYGINKGYIYPELEKQINQIKDDVMFEYGIKNN